MKRYSEKPKYEIPAWDSGIREQLQKAPKYYFFDTGVINVLTGELEGELRPSTGRFGRLFESFVVTQLLQLKEKLRSPLKFYHYRNNNGREIDLILQRSVYSPPIALEIKSSTAPGVAEVPALVDFKNVYPEAKTCVLCRTPRSYTIEGIQFLSIEDLPQVFELEDEKNSPHS